MTGFAQKQTFKNLFTTEAQRTQRKNMFIVIAPQARLQYKTLCSLCLCGEKSF